MLVAAVTWVLAGSAQMKVVAHFLAGDAGVDGLHGFVVGFYEFLVDALV